MQTPPRIVNDYTLSGKSISAGKTLGDAGIRYGSFLQVTSRVRGEGWGSEFQDILDAVDERKRILEEAKER